MKQFILPSKPVLLILAASLSAAFFCAAAEDSANKSNASPLAPLAFFTAHEWNAQLPDSPDGQKMSIHARFTWSENHRAIRISNQFSTDGKASPYIDGLYAWNPQKRVIVFTYVGTEGSLSEGTVRVENGQLVHEFTEIHADGKVDALVAKVTPHGTQSWDNAILRAQRRNADAARAGEIFAGAVGREFFTDCARAKSESVACARLLSNHTAALTALGSKRSRRRRSPSAKTFGSACTAPV